MRAGPLGAGQLGVGVVAATGAAAASSVVVPHPAAVGSSAAAALDRQMRPKPRLTRQSAIHDDLLDPPGSPGRLTVRSVGIYRYLQAVLLLYIERTVRSHVSSKTHFQE